MATKSPITMLTSAMLVAFHNQLIDTWKIKGIKTVSKFRDRIEAEKRVLSLFKDIPLERQAEDLPVILRKICAPKEVIDMVLKIAANPKARTHAPHTPGPATTIEPGSTPKASPAAQPETSEPKKKGASKIVTGKTALGLIAIRELIGDKTGEHAQTDSASIAKQLKTSPNAVCKILDQLFKMGHVEVEDDTTGTNDRFMYVKLLPTGRTCEVNAEEPEPAAEGKPTKASKLPSAAPGPNSKFDGKKLFKLVQENPRHPGTHGFRSFAALKDGMTFEAYRQAGGRNNDLQWDIDHKWVEAR